MITAEFPHAPGRKAVAPRKSVTALCLSGSRLTRAICLLSSCVALSAEPAAKWSAACVESEHLCVRYVTGGVIWSLQGEM
jgi:hypothetical protein